MVSKFLLGFSESFVGRLLADGRLQLVPGAETPEVVTFVAEQLADQEPGQSLIAALAGALEACPAVEEIFADDEELREAANDVPASALPR